MINFSPKIEVTVQKNTYSSRIDLILITRLPHAPLITQI